jgi:flagellar basal body-associated protein FliL
MADLTEESLANESPEPESKSTKKKGLPIIPIAIVVVLVIAIGAVAWFFVMPMLSGPPAEVAEEGMQEQQAEQPEESEATTDMFDPQKPGGIIEFTEPFLVNLKPSEGVISNEAYLQVSISLEVGSLELKEEMEKEAGVMSRVRDSINTFFHSKYPHDVQQSQWPLLKDQLKAAINERLPEKYRVTHVYFNSFLIQR